MRAYATRFFPAPDDISHYDLLLYQSMYILIDKVINNTNIVSVRIF